MSYKCTIICCCCPSVIMCGVRCAVRVRCVRSVWVRWWFAVCPGWWCAVRLCPLFTQGDIGGRGYGIHRGVRLSGICIVGSSPTYTSKNHLRPFSYFPAHHPDFEPLRFLDNDRKPFPGSSNPHKYSMSQNTIATDPDAIFCT